MNELGISGIEFIEYATSNPTQFGAVLETMGFAPVARHRSRDVLLYRQGDLNVIVNADPKAAPRHPPEGHEVILKALAIRVADAALAYKEVLAQGGAPVPSRAGPMELHIPGIHGAGNSVIYFLDRRTDVAFYEVDFLPLPEASFDVPALGGMHFFGIVQYIGAGQTGKWCEFYGAALGFTVLPEHQRFGVLPKGTILASPNESFFLQLIEPPASSVELHWEEGFVRVGLGVPKVEEAVQLLHERGIDFVDSSLFAHPELGALTRTLVGGTQFELVHHELKR